MRWALSRSPHIKVLDTLSYNKNIATINRKPATARPLGRGSRTCTVGGESNQPGKSIRNSLRNKDFTSNPFNLKDLAERASKSLIPKDRREGDEPANIERSRKFQPQQDYCLILGFTAEYSKSVRKFTATYVSPIARIHPCTR